jgi:hypothetical protein
LAYCKSFTAQLLTLSPAKLYSSFTLSQISNLVSSNTNYFIGLSEQPSDSGQSFGYIPSLLFIYLFQVIGIG